MFVLLSLCFCLFSHLHSLPEIDPLRYYPVLSTIVSRTQSETSLCLPLLLITCQDRYTVLTLISGRFDPRDTIYLKSMSNFNSVGEILNLVELLSDLYSVM